jgi:hypothetical protein
VQSELHKFVFVEILLVIIGQSVVEPREGLLVTISGAPYVAMLTKSAIPLVGLVVGISGFMVTKGVAVVKSELRAIGASCRRVTSLVSV